MVMTLTANESGNVNYLKRPGAVLEAGSVIATLDLDDPSLVTKAVLYKEPFPELDVSQPFVPEKLNLRHATYKNILENSLAGNKIDLFFDSFRNREIFS